ncbi:MAG: hypothetical protein HQ483_05785 [Rhodospirillales bacterium]|nr:hypothetical protein [Rhodospirillales bacterium]
MQNQKLIAEENLNVIANEATKGINEILITPLTADQTNQVSEIIQKAVIKAMLQGQHSAVDAALDCPEADQDIAHKIATAIRHKNDALIANLSSLR